MEISEIREKVRKVLDVKTVIRQKQYKELYNNLCNIEAEIFEKGYLDPMHRDYLLKLNKENFRSAAYFLTSVIHYIKDILVERIDTLDETLFPDIIKKVKNEQDIRDILNAYKKKNHLSERAMELYILNKCWNADRILNAYHSQNKIEKYDYSKYILFEMMDEMIRGNNYDYKGVANYLYKIELNDYDRQIFNNKMDIINQKLMRDPKKIQPKGMMNAYLILVAKQNFEGVLDKSILENVIFKKLGGTTYGLYNGREIVMADNRYPRTLKGNLDSLNTIFHEGRHAYQRERMMSENILDFSMENLRMAEEEVLMINVPTYYKNHFNYCYSNQQEADARMHGDVDLYKFIKKENPQFAKQFLKDKLNDYKKNSKIKKQHRIFKGHFSPISEDSTNFFTRTVSKNDIARSRNLYPILRVKYDEEGNLRPLEKLIEVYMDLDKRIKTNDKTTLQYRKDITLYKLYLELIKDYMLRTKNTNKALINRSTRDQVEDFLASNGRGR